MKRTLLVLMLVFLSVMYLSAADDITGIWKGIDEKTGETTMFIYLYEYHGKVFGRMIVTYRDGKLKDLINKPDAVADKWVGDPFFAGMDIIWNMEDKGNRWKKGKICDPKEGKIYSSEMWREGDNLIVRGKIGPFGRNQTWRPVHSGDLPPGLDYGDPSTWIPVIPELK